MTHRTLWRGLSAVVVVVVVVIIIGLVGRSCRQEPASEVAATPAAAPADTTGQVAHPRAPVDVEPSRLPAIGVRTEPVRRETIANPLRAIATVVLDESRISHVHTRVAGWIEELHVSTTGQSVRAGAPLASIFSQELLSSQNEYLIVRRGLGQGPASVVLEGARARLKVLGMTEAEIQAIEATGEARRLVTVVAPRSGVVVHRGISVGTAVDPSTELLTIADLTRVWVIAEIPEANIPELQRDTTAELMFPASGRPPFSAGVDFLYPTLTERTRTLRVRFVVDNRDGTLRPGLYGEARFQAASHDALTIPRDAVVDTGVSQHVFVVETEGRFVPRPIELGQRLDERVEVRAGLSAGESIVASGVFLIDSESRLRASGGGTGHVHGAAPEGKAPPPSPSKPATTTPPTTTPPTTTPVDHQGHGAPAPAPASSSHGGHKGPP
ncbi:MAG: efflux RND transporter periplasmic adaptor subunit [Deltaproteobacteria bacterium]|nr:efflux RND transporter periplasmic adaptor subunit [Deltaproteobacteria bacterium]